ncbi:Nn.00g080900.m01.CDS01 [Neocucurbitaria sp. VM-36]
MGSRFAEIRDDGTPPEQDARDAIARLESSIPTISTILDVTRTPSAVVGVLYGGRIIFATGIGICDQESGRVPDIDTIFSIGSCTKAFTATALHILQKKHKWDVTEAVSSYIPEFVTKHNEDVSKAAHMQDLLSHATGLANLCFSASGRFAEVLPTCEDIVHICSSLPKVSQFRASFKYNNWFYALASQIIPRKTGRSWATVVKEEILDPMGMTRTFASAQDVDDNYARSYTMVDDGSMHAASRPCVNAGSPFEGSGSLRSCVRDLLKWAAFLVEAAQSEETDKRSSSMELEDEAERPVQDCNLLLESLREIQRSCNPLSPSSSQAYGQGLYVLNFPAVDLNKFTNSGVTTTSQYRLGQSSPPQMVLGHTGEIQNFTSAYWVFPSTASCVVVLANGSGAYGDASSLIAQVLTQALFNLEPAVDFEFVARDIYSNSKKVWSNTVQLWRAHRRMGTTPCEDLDAYTGRYVCSDLRMTLDITIHPQGEEDDGDEISDVSDRPDRQLLRVQINGMANQVFVLSHYHNDSWSFMPRTMDEALLHGYRNYIENWASFVIDFTHRAAEEEGVFVELSWQLGINEAVDAQRFRKQGY